MGRALTAVAALLVLCFVIFGTTVYLSREEDQIAVDNLLAEDLTRAFALAEEETGGRVDLARVADFEWERVLVVERGTPPEAITRRLGFPWLGDVPIEQGDVFIFLHEGRVARYADYRGNGEFIRLERPFDELAREEAVFAVRNLVFFPA